MARRYDPERRRRIIEAAIRVVGRSGIAGLSHRSVAAEADVPLGSTTYHFKTLDELLVAALRQTNEGFAKAVASHGGLEDPRTDLATELAGLLGEWLAGERAGVELEYELYLAALRGRPAPRRGRVVRGRRRTAVPPHRPGHRPRPGRADGRHLSPGPADRHAVRRGVRAGDAGAHPAGELSGAVGAPLRPGAVPASGTARPAPETARRRFAPPGPSRLGCPHDRLDCSEHHRRSGRRPRHPHRRRNRPRHLVPRPRTLRRARPVRHRAALRRAGRRTPRRRRDRGDRTGRAPGRRSGRGPYGHLLARREADRRARRLPPSPPALPPPGQAARPEPGGHVRLPRERRLDLARPRRRRRRRRRGSTPAPRACTWPSRPSTSSPA